jgi:cytochrome c oxidase assembly protein subunit 15
VVLTLSQSRALGRDDRAIAVWLVGCAAMIAVMVVLGGITRLTESGLSITEWQPIAGVLPPLGEAAWQAEFAKYQEIPQFRLVHAWMSLADFKSIYFWEWLHRLWGRLIGLAFAVPFAWFVLRRRVSRPLLPRLAGLFVLGGLQGALGWFMVESGLSQRVEVSQYRLVAHLGLAVLIYAAILRVALGLLWPVPSGAARAMHRAAAGLCILVFVTMLAGGFVAGLNAGLTYNTFPLMDGRFFPAGYFQLQPWWLNAFENVTSVQFDHRLLAMTTVAAVVAVWSAARPALPPGRARAALDALLAIAAAQLGLGIATLLLVVPIPLAALHQAGALALFTAALVVHHALRGASARAVTAGEPPDEARLDEKRPSLL